MFNKIQTILHRATKKDKLNILTFPTHERYETCLSKTGHSFYAWGGPNIKRWNSTYASIPDNYTILNTNRKDNQLYKEIGIDLVLSQSKFGQFTVAKQLSHYLGAPLISLEHTLPMDSWSIQQLESMRNMEGDINVFISEYSREQWGWSENDALVVHHGIDTDLFNPGNKQRENRCLSVVNDWVNRDYFCGYRIWKNATKNLPVYVLGDTPGLSKPAKDINELVEAYQSSRIFINTSTVSPIPTALLEAMSCGCACVSTATCMIPEIIENGVNGLISNDPQELRGYIELLLKDENKAKEMGEAARQTILNKFGLEHFTTNWNVIFDKAMEI